MELTASIKEQLISTLSGGTLPVEIILYKGSEPSEETKEILDLLNGIAETVSFVSVKEMSTKEGLERYPAIEICNPGKEHSYTYFGLPAGYEFSSLVEAIRTTSVGKADLSDELITKIQSITKPVHLEVFVTPTCPQCPSMVVAAFRLSYTNPLIKVDIVEATSFRSYSRGKGVMGVPKTIINNATDSIDGPIPIDEFVLKILASANNS